MQPKHSGLGSEVGKACAGVVHRYKSVDAVSGGEDAGKGAPEGGQRTLRPRYAGDEEQQHGGEDDEHDARLAVAYQSRKGDGEEDGRQEEGHDEECKVVRHEEMVEAEQAGHDDQHVDSQRQVDEQIHRGFAQYEGYGVGGLQPRRHEQMPRVAFAARPRRHADAEQQRLLQHEDKHGGDEEGGKAVLRVVKANVLVLNGVLHHPRLFLRGSGRALHFQLCVHFQRGVHRRGVDGLVIEHAAHVGKCAYGGLLAGGEVGGEGARNVDDAVSLAPLHSGLCFFHVGGVGHDVRVGRGVDVSQKLAALRRAVVVYGHHRHLAYRLVRVDEAIKQGVGEGHDEEENHHALVAQGGAPLCEKVAEGAAREVREYIFQTIGHSIILLVGESAKLFIKAHTPL